MPKQVITQILENTDKESVLQELKAEIKKKISQTRNLPNPYFISLAAWIYNEYIRGGATSTEFF